MDDKCLAIRFNPPGPQTFKTVTLWPNIVDDVNTLTQSMLYSTDTRYIVKYDYVLGEDIAVPANCVLEFEGGSIANANGNVYTIRGNNTFVGECVNVFGTGMWFVGTWNIPVISTDMFKDLSAVGALRVLNVLMATNNSNHIDVFIKDKGYDYTINMADDGATNQFGLSIPSNTDLYISTTIKVTANGASGYRLITVQSANNVHIYGGELIGDLDEHTYNDDSQSCHGIGVYQSSNVMIEGVHVHDFPGDCIEFSGIQSDSGTNIDCNLRGVRIVNCKVHDCRRNGIEVTNSEDCIIEGCEIYNVEEVHPTSPAIGQENAILIEPNRVSATINGYARGIVIWNCKVHDCVRGIFTVNPPDDGSGKLPCICNNLLIENIYFKKVTSDSLKLIYPAKVDNIVITDAGSNIQLYVANEKIEINGLDFQGYWNGTTFAPIIHVEGSAILKISNSILNLFSLENYASTVIIENSVHSITALSTNTGVVKLRNCNITANGMVPKGTMVIEGCTINTTLFGGNHPSAFNFTEEATVFIKNNIFQAGANANRYKLSYIYCNVEDVMNGVIAENIFNCYNSIGVPILISQSQAGVKGDDNIFIGLKDNYTGTTYLTPINKRLVRGATRTSILSSLALSNYEQGAMTFCTDLNTTGAPIWWNGSAWVDATGTPV